MEVFEAVIALLLIGVVLAAVARRIGAPYPALVALCGAGLALIPGVPTLTLDPELALTLFVAPVLADAAFDSSPRDMRANWRIITGLALGAVILTIAVVAVVARMLVPDMPWAVAIALGAIVAPPDAAAATAVLKQVRPPHRLLVILEGESLFNDASALLVYRLAVVATVVGALSGWSILPQLLLVSVGSVVLGIAFARITTRIIARIEDVSTAVVFQFCSVFASWILAERLHLSGIITLVVHAMVASRSAPESLPARIRIPSWAVWEVAVFVLNVLAFILVGFQLRSIADRVSGATGAEYVRIAAMVTVAVIIARFLWVTGAAAVARRRAARTEGMRDRHRSLAVTAKSAAVVGWCGMRGTVTLAAALAIPMEAFGGHPFPYRDLILVCAFGVVLGTLVVQGLTLKPLLLRLRLEDDGSVEREIRLARATTLEAAVASLAQVPQAKDVPWVAERYESALQKAREALASARDQAEDEEAAVVRAAIAAQRHRLVALRNDGTIGDAALQRIEEELDRAELNWIQ